MCNAPSCNIEECDIANGECHCRCGGKTRVAVKNNTKSGDIKGKPRKYIQHHGSRTSPVEYIINEETGCWEWQLSLDKDGYGRKTIGGKGIRAHRYMYEKFKGTIPNNLPLDHLCLNKSCVNPEHLEIVTVAENTRRGSSANLNWDVVNKARELFSLGITRKEISLLLEVDARNLWHVLTNKTWRVA